MCPDNRSVEPSGQRLYAGHRNRSFGPRLALASVAEVLVTRVGIPPRLSSRPLLWDSSSHVQGRGVWPLDNCASACISGQVCQMVTVFVSGDAGVSRDSVDLGCNGVCQETRRPSVRPRWQMLRWARPQVCCSSNCRLVVADDCHHLLCLHLHCFSLLDRHVKS